MEGSLAENPLSTVLKQVATSGQDGLLVLSWQGKRVFVSCKQGEILHAWEGEEDALLGAILVRSGKITQEQLENGLRIQKNIRQSFMRTLIEMGYVTQQQIKPLIRIISEEAIYPIFDWPAGSFSFEAKPVTYDPEMMEPFPIDVIIQEGLHRAEIWPHLLEAVPSLQAVYELTGIPAQRLNDPERMANLSYEATQVLMEETLQRLEREETGEWVKAQKTWEWLISLIDGHRSVQEIIREAEVYAFSAFSVYSGLDDLLKHKVIKAKDEIYFEKDSVSQQDQQTDIFKDEIIKPKDKIHDKDTSFERKQNIDGDKIRVSGKHSTLFDKRDSFIVTEGKNQEAVVRQGGVVTKRGIEFFEFKKASIMRLVIHGVVFGTALWVFVTCLFSIKTARHALQNLITDGKQTLTDLKRKDEIRLATERMRLESLNQDIKISDP